MPEQNDACARVYAALDPVAAQHDIAVVDVEVVGAKNLPTLRIRIDHADQTLPTITLDEVCAQNEWIDQVIEGLDLFEDAYTLEVSSPGLARPLRRLEDFKRFIGATVKIRTNAQQGRKRFQGILKSVTEQKVCVECLPEDGSSDPALYTFDINEIQRATVVPDIEM